MANLQGTKVLITGGAGFIGSHLADRLIKEGVHEIRIIDDLSRGCLNNLRSAMSSSRVRFVQGDIRDRTLINSLVRGCDLVFHLAAWRIHRCEEQPAEAIDVMIKGTYTVFDAAIRNHVPRVIFASSASVYGQASQFPTPESHPPYNNTTLYGWAKLYGEGLARWCADNKNLSAICLRFFNVYGSRMDREGRYTEVMIRWLDGLLRDVPPIIHGDGSASYDFVHVHDVVSALILAANCFQHFAIYNVGSGTETSLLTLARTLTRLCGKTNLEPSFQPSASPKVYRRWACLGKSHQELGYQPAYTLETGLQELIEWYCCRREHAAFPTNNLIAS